MNIFKFTTTDLDVPFLSVWFPLPLSFFVFALLFLAGGEFTFLAAAVFVAPAVPVSLLVSLLLLLVSVDGAEHKSRNVAECTKHEVMQSDLN